MRPLEPPKKPKHKPLLQRMAEDKAAQREHGSQCGSGFFMVQLPDGTYEKRPKAAANADPGVHSNLKLDEVSGPRFTSAASIDRLIVRSLGWRPSPRRSSHHHRSEDGHGSR